MRLQRSYITLFITIAPGDEEFDAVESPGQTEVERVLRFVEGTGLPKAAKSGVRVHALDQLLLAAPPLRVRDTGRPLFVKDFMDLLCGVLYETGDQRDHRHHLGGPQPRALGDLQRAS